MIFDGKSDVKDSQFPPMNGGSGSSQAMGDASPPPYTASPATTSSSPPSSLAQHCNYLLEHNERHSVKGTWQVDTALVVPESLLPFISECNGAWNEMDKNSIKGREKNGKKHQTWIYEPTPANQGVRPNLMLRSRIGRVQGEVHVTSGDGVPRMAVIVAESKEDSAKLQVTSAPDQPLRIFAASTESSVHVSIPSTFQGLICMNTNEGRIQISDGVKSRLTTFSTSGRSMRGYLGDTQGPNFGKEPASTSSSLSGFMSANQDPFKNWTGPLVNLSSVEGSVHISLVEENKNKKTSKDSVSDVFDVISTVLGVF
ncbi:hypothetical protein FRC08_007987 [Ceratobasidium sp. 394]|nr:hypothetical protein FRC08_007987 [Ceratobasidium sp. 394]KAG9088063.1 hypothetical protein FS749_002452 [Ceratobasidium sp. UAMH 11750]